MNVRELKKQLDGVEDDTVVILSGDSEGNSFSPLVELSFANYMSESQWHGDIEDVEDIEDGEQPGQKAIVLWPTN